jgi:hypothetical protein
VVVDGAGSGRLGLHPRPRREVAVQGSRHLARHAVDVLAVGPVRCDLELEHVVGDREMVDQRVAHRPVVREQHDPGVILAQVELALREHHAV